MPLKLQETLTFRLLINSVDYWKYLVTGSLSTTSSDGGEVGSLSFSLENYDGTVDLNSLLFTEVLFEVVETNYRIFGGYLIDPGRSYSGAGNRSLTMVKAESWSTRLSRTPTISKTYIDVTFRAVITDILTSSGITDLVSTPVIGDTLISVFSTAGESVSEAFTALATRFGVGCTWNIDNWKNVKFGLPVNYQAPFEIAELSNANWTTTFPALKDSLSRSNDFANYVNRVTVPGTDSVSDWVEDHFQTTQNINNLTHDRIWQVGYIATLDPLDPLGEALRYIIWGVEGQHVMSEPGVNDGIDALVNLYNGTVTIKPGLSYIDELFVLYTYVQKVDVTRTVLDIGGSNPSGIWLDKKLTGTVAPSVTIANQIADTYLQEFSQPIVHGTFGIWMVGLEPLMAIKVEDSILGFTGYYAIRRVTITLDPSRSGVIATVEFGGSAPKFSSLFASVQSANQGTLFASTASSVQQTTQGKIVTVSANYLSVIVDDVIVVDSSLADITVTLPAASSCVGHSTVIKDGAGNANNHPITVVVANGGYIDGSLSVVINSAYSVATFYSNGTKWLTITASASAASDHGMLTGLSDDDHTQYARAAASSTDHAIASFDSTTGRLLRNTKMSVTDNGALQAIGGDTRGLDAIDLQVSRTNADKVASGSYAVIGGGSDNKADATYAVVGGGFNNSANGAYSAVLGGAEAYAFRIAEIAHSAGKFVEVGDSQASKHVLHAITTNGTRASLSANGSTAYLPIQANSTNLFDVKVIARRQDVSGESAAYILQGCFDNFNGTTSLVGSFSETILAADNSTWSVTVETDNAGLLVYVTGETGKTIYWVAYVTLVEVVAVTAGSSGWSLDFSKSDYSAYLAMF